MLVVFLLIIEATCFSDTNSEEFEFAKDYIRSLHHVKMVEEIGSNSPVRANYANETAFYVAVMGMYKSAQVEFRKAISLMEEYRDSNNPLIAEAADLILKCYVGQVLVAEDVLNTMEEVFNNLDVSKYGTYMRRMSNQQVNSQQLMEALVYATLSVNLVLASNSSDKKDDLGYLAINSNEREKLIKQIDEIFGEKIKDGLYEGISQLDACAATLHILLTGKHKSSDER